MADPLSSEANGGGANASGGLPVGLSDDAVDPLLSAATAAKTVSPATARRIRTDSNATQREGAVSAGEAAASSFTPRGHDSPLARRLALAAAAPTDAERPSLSRQSTVGAGSTRGRRRYDPTTRRNLVHGAASDGDLVRLQALLTSESAPPNTLETDAPDEEVASDDRPASTFALANEPNPHSGLAPIHLAAQNGHEDVVKWLVEEAGALPDFEDAAGETPLHKAALRGHLDVCRFLLSRQVDINAADNDGWTPLHNAASRGWLDVAQLLTTFRADPDVQNRHGFTPLMNAASKGHLPLVHFLLRQAGAEPLRRNVWGETAFDLAASVFELEICRALAAAEERATFSGSAATLQIEGSTRRRRYNPLALHVTVPVVLYENQRLVTPSLRRPASLVTGQGDALVWSARALTRNDQRTAFSLPDMIGIKAGDADANGTELPCFKSEIGLPVVGKENELILPPRREIRSGGRVQSEQPQRPRPTPRRSSSRSSVPGSAASPSTTPGLDDETTPDAIDGRVDSRPEPAWMWISEWTVDRTAPTSSPVDGWSYAPSFDTPAEEWTAGPPPDASGTLLLPTSASGPRKWVRRRLWTRVMRRRVDLPDWGFDDEPHRVDDSAEELQDLTRVGYRARARYFAGEALPELDPSEVGALDDANHRKAIMQLERAVEELRQGLIDEADEITRREAQAELEEYLRLLAPLQSRGDGSDGTPSEEAAFVYSGVDAEEDDARSIWTSMRSPSVASSSAGGRQVGSRTASFQSTHSNRPVLTAQSAPEFRIPTNELAAPSRSHASPQLQTQSLRPPWEPDHATNACRRCSKHFSLLNRRHHCRRCGLVVCSACSPHSDRLDPRQVAIEPGTLADDSPWLLDSPFGYRYRTCNDCHAALALIPSDAGPSSLLSPQAFFPASPSLPGSAAPSEAAASDVSELTECPVCGETLAQLGDKSQQEGHIRECLEAGKGTIASGRYLLFRLPPGPLVGEDCTICWTEFEIGDRMARLVCLCTFHEKCLSGWLARGNSCPVHALRE